MQFIMFGSEKNKCSPSPRLITRQSHRKFRGKVEQKNNVKKSWSQDKRPSGYPLDFIQHTRRMV